MTQGVINPLFTTTIDRSIVCDPSVNPICNNKFHAHYQKLLQQQQRITITEYTTYTHLKMRKLSHKEH